MPVSLARTLPTPRRDPGSRRKVLAQVMLGAVDDAAPSMMPLERGGGSDG